jgi:hypothetical protein
LEIAEMFDGESRRLRPIAKRRVGVEALRVQPDRSGLR